MPTHLHHLSLFVSSSRPTHTHADLLPLSFSFSLSLSLIDWSQHFSSINPRKISLSLYSSLCSFRALRMDSISTWTWRWRGVTQNPARERQMRGVIQNPARERERRYSKSNKRERGRGVVQNPARERGRKGERCREARRHHIDIIAHLERQGRGGPVLRSLFSRIRIIDFLSHRDVPA